MRVITIGIDPHQSSHTAVAIDAAGHKTGQRRFVVNAGTFGQLTRWCALNRALRQRPLGNRALSAGQGLVRGFAGRSEACVEEICNRTTDS